MISSKYINRCQGILYTRGWRGLFKFIASRIVRLSKDLIFEKSLGTEDFSAEIGFYKYYKVFFINASNLQDKENKWVIKSTIRGENLEYLEGLKRKDCMVAIATGDKVVHTSFVQFETSYKKMLAETNTTPLIGNCWTSQEHRGKGLYPYAIAFCCREMAKRGHRRIIISCAPKNFSSVAGIKKAGFKKIKIVTNISILTKIYLQKSISTKEEKTRFKIGVL